MPFCHVLFPNMTLLIQPCHQSYPKNYCQDQCQEVFVLCFFLVVLQFKVLMFRFLIHFELILFMVKVQFYSSAYGYSVVPTPFIEEAILALLCVLGNLVKNQTAINYGFISGLFCSIGPYVLLKILLCMFTFCIFSFVICLFYSFPHFSFFFSF